MISFPVSASLKLSKFPTTGMKSKAEETRLPNEKEKTEGKYNKNTKTKTILIFYI